MCEWRKTRISISPRPKRYRQAKTTKPHNWIVYRCGQRGKQLRNIVRELWIYKMSEISYNTYMRLREWEWECIVSIYAININMKCIKQQKPNQKKINLYRNGMENWRSRRRLRCNFCIVLIQYGTSVRPNQLNWSVSVYAAIFSHRRLIIFVSHGWLYRLDHVILFHIDFMLCNAESVRVRERARTRR